jgi:PspC domain
VCGGLAQYLNTDATLIRVLFVVLALLGGPGIVIYLQSAGQSPARPTTPGLTCGNAIYVAWVPSWSNVSR